MGKRQTPTQKAQTLHTLIIKDALTAWEKMSWDIDVFGDIQRAYPDASQPLAYATLNACISAKSLEGWARSEWKRKLRQQSKKPKSTTFDDLLTAIVPHQGLCSDVANTAKHGTHNEDRWKDGKLAIGYETATEHNPAGYAVLNESSDQVSYLYNDLHALPSQWWKFLQQIELVSGVQPTPDWQKRKWEEMFGEG